MAALIASVSLHLWWRARLRNVEATHRAELSRLQDKNQRERVQDQTQQEAVLNSMLEGLLLLDDQGRIQLANRAFSGLFGISLDLRGKTIMEAVRSHELSEVVEMLGSRSRVVDHELRVSHPTPRWLRVNGAAILSDDGQRRGTVLVFHDLTRLKQLESARTDFVANVSHELRTPLSLIKGYVETLLDGAKDNPEVADKFLRTVDRNAERLKLLIDDLLTISELESRAVQLNLQDVNLKRLTEKVLAEFQSRATAKAIRLKAEMSELTVRGDAGRLEQVLGNLVDNAIKYGRPEGTVVVAARATEDQRIEVSVRDDGPGIPPESLERIFERFYRVDKARSREQGGTGLGLSIVKHIIQSHQGRVWAESELGKGATVLFTLPRA
jgi:two-component system phosphate regulon sensor histidine kinase PhoR